MARFKFRLQRVLDYRTSAVEAQETEVSKCLAAVTSAREHLVDVFTRQRRTLELLEGKSEGRLDTEQAATAWRYLDLLRTEERAAREQVAQAEAELQHAREVLTHLKREEQIIQKLKQRKQKEALREEQLREAKYLDDLATIRFNRTASEVQAE